MSDAPRVLRVTPRLDWRQVAGAEAVAPAAGIGGLAAQVTRLAQATGALGIEQTVLALRPPSGPDSGSLGPQVGVRAVGNGRTAGVHRSQLAWLAALLPALRRARASCDVVHVHASGVIEPLLAAIAARVLVRRPIVLTLHCSAIVTYVAQSRRDAAVQVLTRAAERVAIALAARTLVLTERARAKLGRPRVEAFADCLVAARYRDADGAAFAARHGIAGDRPVVLFVGRVSREKGAAVLPELARRTGAQVVVCGDGPELAALRDRGLTLAGAVSEDDVAAALKCADVLVLPSQHEELGSVLLEAMAAGLPAVAYDVGGTSEAIVDGVTGRLAPAGDAAALARTVAAVLDDAALRESAGSEGPRLAAQRYDVTVAGARLAAIYRELAR